MASHDDAFAFMLEQAPSTRSRSAQAPQNDVARLVDLFLSLREGDAYGGVGSRETPNDVCEDMAAIAAFLESRCVMLRSGGADGSDLAFERGTRIDALRQIFLPNRFFNKHRSRPYRENIGEKLWLEALQIAKSYHPKWSAIEDFDTLPDFLRRKRAFARNAMTRNSFQVLGPNLRSPSKALICWTSDGGPSGGTGQAIRIATDRGIPVLNLHDHALRSAIMSAISANRA